MERADAIHRALTPAALHALDLVSLAEHLSDLLKVEVTNYGAAGAVLAASSAARESGVQRHLAVVVGRVLQKKLP